MSDRIEAGTFSDADAAQVLPKRGPGAHKWGVGGLLIIAGSPGYVGAPALAAMAAQRVGAGIVNLAVPRGLIGPIATIVPEAAFVAMPDGEIGSNSDRLMRVIAHRAERCKAFLVGPGLGDDAYATDVVRTVLGIGSGFRRMTLGFGTSTASSTEAGSSLLSFDRPIVVDADGLNVLAGIEHWYDGLPQGRLVLTPHVGEMARLLEATPDDVLAGPDAAVVEASTRFGQTVVLKGDPTIVAAGRTVWTGPQTPASLATAGSGDVLAGAIAGLLAQGLGATDAANLAILAGARAASALETEVGVLGVVAGDLPRAMAIEIAKIASR